MHVEVPLVCYTHDAPKQMNSEHSFPVMRTQRLLMYRCWVGTTSAFWAVLLMGEREGWRGPLWKYTGSAAGPHTTTPPGRPR